LRGLVETTLQVEYMLAENPVQRGLAYHVQHIHKRIDSAEKRDPNTEKGKQHAAIVSKDAVMGGIQRTPVDSTAKVAALRRVLATPELAPIEKEWQSVRAGPPKKSKVWWYTLYGGPKTIELLAQSLSKHGWYEDIYRMLSGATHGSDALESFRAKKGQGLFVKPLRHPQSAPTCGRLAVILGLHLINVLNARYASQWPAGSSKWYVEQIQSEFLELQNIEFTDGGS